MTKFYQKVGRRTKQTSIQIIAIPQGPRNAYCRLSLVGRHIDPQYVVCVIDIKNTPNGSAAQQWAEVWAICAQLEWRLQ